MSHLAPTVNHTPPSSGTLFQGFSTFWRWWLDAGGPLHATAAPHFPMASHKCGSTGLAPGQSCAAHQQPMEPHVQLAMRKQHMVAVQGGGCGRVQATLPPPPLPACQAAPVRPAEGCCCSCPCPPTSGPVPGRWRCGWWHMVVGGGAPSPPAGTP